MQGSKTKTRTRKTKTAPVLPNDLSTSISAIRDMLIIFRRLIVDINEISNKYKTSPSNFGTSMFPPDLMAKATSAMPPERLGFFMSAMFEAASLTDGLQNFMSYDTHQMTDLREKMDSALKKLDKVLEE